MKKLTKGLLLSTALVGILPAISLTSCAKNKTAKMSIDGSEAYKDVYGHFADAYATYGVAYIRNIKYSNVDVNDLEVKVESLTGIIATTTAKVVKDEEQAGYLNVYVTFESEDIIFTKTAGFNLLFTNKKDTSQTYKIEGCSSTFLSYVLNAELSRTRFPLNFLNIPNEATTSCDMYIYKGLTEPVGDLSDLVIDVIPLYGTETELKTEFDKKTDEYGSVTLKFNLSNLQKGDNHFALRISHKMLPDWYQVFHLSFNIGIAAKAYNYIKGPDGLYIDRLLVSDAEVTIPDEDTYEGQTYPVVTINNYAFNGCRNLKKVTIGKNIATIKESAFANCALLQSILVNKGVKNISGDAFRKCESLTDLRVEDDPDAVYSSKTSATSQTEAGCIWKKSSKTLVASSIYPTLPEGIEKIGDCGLKGTFLEKIVIPDTVTYIGVECFAESPYLKEVTLPSTITGIPSETFAECYLLEKVNLPQTVTNWTIGRRAFQDCMSLTSMTLPEGIVKLQNAFPGCILLKSITIPKSVTDIYTSIFAGCVSLDTINITEGGKYTNTFNGVNCNCIIDPTSGQEKIIAGCASSKIPEGIKIIDSEAFAATFISDVTFPTSLVAIGEGAFLSCGIEELDLSGCTNLEIIGDGAFTQSSYLTKVKLDNTKIDSIGYETFSDCNYLEEVSLPTDIVEIEKYAFEHCSSLKTINLNQLTKLNYIRDKAFADCKSLAGDIVLAEGLLTLDDNCFARTAIKSISIPSTVNSLTNPFPGCINLETIVVADANTKYTSKDDTTQCNCVCETSSKKLISGCKNTTIPSFVTTIAGWSFEAHETLSKITIPENVNLIQDNAFNTCTGLTEVTFVKTDNWQRDGEKISEQDLRDPVKAANLIKNRVSAEWRRTA